jgi:proteasome lid subunit RPN8/RPN11
MPVAMGEVNLVVPLTAYRIMQEHVAAAAPEEACGLLCGEGHRILDALPVENAEHSPVRFRMSPLGQVEAMLDIERRGLELLAIYHSHPLGPDVPSPTDLAEAAYPLPQFIWSCQTGRWGAKLFRLGGSTAHEMEFIVGGAERGDPGHETGEARGPRGRGVRSRPERG